MATAEEKFQLTRRIQFAVEGAIGGTEGGSPSGKGERVRQGRGRGLSGLSGRPSSSPSQERTVGKGVHAALSFVMCSV